MRPAFFASGAAALLVLLAAPGAAGGAVRVGWQDQRAVVLPSAAPLAMAAGAAIGAREMRLIVLWSRVQPDSASQWEWGQYDEAVAGALAAGFAVQLVVGGVGDSPPAWAGGRWRLMNEAAYAALVANAAARYAGRVRLWSVLNEVDLTGYPASRYAALFSRSRRAIRRLAPASRVLWGEFSPRAPLTFTRRALRRHRVVADGFAIHPYGHEHAPREGGLSRLGAVAKAVRRFRRVLTPAGRPLPLYGTEFGCQARQRSEVDCARLWRVALRYADRYRLRELVAYQMLPDSERTVGWDTSLVRADGAPSMAMNVLAAAGRPGVRAA